MPNNTKKEKQDNSLGESFCSKCGKVKDIITGICYCEALSPQSPLSVDSSKYNEVAIEELENLRILKLKEIIKKERLEAQHESMTSLMERVRALPFQGFDDEEVIERNLVLTLIKSYQK